MIKFYENFVIEIIFKNNTINKIYPDGSIISILPSRDMRLISPNGDLFYKFKRVNLNESIYYDKQYKLTRFKNGTIEKLYFKNGIRIIKKSILL